MYKGIREEDVMNETEKDTKNKTQDQEAEQTNVKRLSHFRT